MNTIEREILELDKPSETPNSKFENEQPSAVWRWIKNQGSVILAIVIAAYTLGGKVEKAISSQESNNKNIQYLLNKQTMNDYFRLDIIQDQIDNLELQVTTLPKNEKRAKIEKKIVALEERKSTYKFEKDLIGNTPAPRE